jgi:transposase-like protein
MKSKTKYKDFPIEECVKRVDERILPIGGYVHQKWTCQHCGERMTSEERNTFYQASKCGECGGITIIKECNYMAIFPG